MMNFIKTILSVLILFFSMLSFGQTSIRGKISDRQQDIPFATILLLSMDSVVVQGVVTDSLGTFVIENVVPGHYFISASMIGYSKFFSSLIAVENEIVNLPEIILEEQTTALNEVVVKGDRQRFDQKIDRLIINLEGSITSSGNTILEILQKSPGVVVNRQNNSITINGKSGVRIMINNKMMQLPPDAAMQMLDGMNAANVEKVELITAPSSEYDAEGNGGIIHIVTKGGEDFGTNGSFGLMVGLRWAENLGANFNIHHRDKNTAYFVDYSVVRNHNLHVMKMHRRYLDRNFVQTVSGYSHRENLTTQQNLSAGFEWTVAKNTLLNFLFTGYNRNWDLSAYTHDTNRARMDSTVTTWMKVHESNIWKSATGSLGLQTKIDSKNRIGFNLDYLFYHNDNPSTYDNTITVEQASTQAFSKIDLDKTTPIRSFIAKMDYQYQISPSMVWEAGIKSVTSTLDNNVLVQELVADAWTVDPEFTSYSTLNERILAGYISTKLQAGKQLQINGGLRYEYTHSAISSPDEKNSIKRRYGYFFSAVSVKKNLGGERDFEFSYTRRITRPTYNDIAPYVFFWGPNTFSAGNTSLYPAISDALSAGYHIKQWNMSLQYSHIRNEITMLQPEIDSDNSLVYRSQNLKYLNTLGGTLNYSTSITPWWEFQGTFTAQYQVGETSSFSANAGLELFGVNLNVVNMLRLPKDFAIEISGMYQSKFLSGISKFLPMGSLNAGVQKGFKGKGTLRLSMDDILFTNYWKIRTSSPENGLDNYFIYNWHNQFVRLTYTLNFGNTKLQGLKLRSGSEEERQRVSD